MVEYVVRVNNVKVPFTLASGGMEITIRRKIFHENINGTYGS